MTRSAVSPGPGARSSGAGAPGALPRLLPRGPASLDSHLARYGPPPCPGPGRGDLAALIAEVDRAGLTGRGGAGFPTARKLAAVAAGRAPVVVGNGTEGEPASAKDKVLMARSPHLVLDGAVLAAQMVGASQAVIVAHRDVREILDQAAAERRRARLDRVRVTVRTAADRFVGGEASAVVHWIEHGIPAPTATPPRLSDRGLRGRPTLVQNVETLAHLALIARYGAPWFRSAGTPAEPGSMLVTVLGAVREPCVLEIAIGTPVGEVLDLAGGPSAPLQALLLGGYFGAWVDAAQAVGRPFSAAGLADLGAGPGAGLIAALPAAPAGSARPPGLSATWPASRRASAVLAGSACPRWPANSNGLPRAAPPTRACCAGGSPSRRPRRLRSPERRRRPGPQRPADLRRRTDPARRRFVLRDRSRPARSVAEAAVSARLRVDFIACKGRGLCAEALPELITLDDWGFPIVSGRPVPPRLLPDARETVRACPLLALRLEYGGQLSRRTRKDEGTGRPECASPLITAVADEATPRRQGGPARSRPTRPARGTVPERTNGK